MTDQNLALEVLDLENIVMPCNGRPEGDELPQIATCDDTIVEVVQGATGKPLMLVDAEIHHQTDPSYQ